MARTLILLCTLAVALGPAASEALAGESAAAGPETAAASSETAAPSSETAAALLDRGFQNLYAEDYIQTLVLATQSRGGREMRRRLQITRRQSVRPGKALLRFLYPQSIRRTSVLILENEDASDDFYVYLPAVRITRHLSSAQKGDAFFGTDLTYEDVEPKYVGDFVVRYLEQDAPPPPPGQEPCLMIEITAAPGFESAYDRQVSCLEPKRGVIVFTDYFVKGRHLKRLSIDPKEVRRVGDRWIPFLITVETPRARSVTRVITEDYELRASIPDRLFNAWNLEGGDAKGDRRRTTPTLDAEEPPGNVSPADP
jgi:hypothetical protein